MAASVAVISVLLLKLKLVVEVTTVSLVEVALEAGVYVPQISALVTSQVLPLELAHLVTLLTTNNQVPCLLKKPSVLCAQQKT